MRRGEALADEEFLQVTLRHADVVHALARRLAAQPGDVADLVQETYLRAYAAWGARGPDNPGAWLATICLNVGRDELRRRARRERAVDAGPVPDLPGPDDTAEAAVANVRRDLVHEALWQLPPAQRVAITLMDLCGFTAAEAAGITGAPRGTILARVHRGRKALARQLADQDDRRWRRHEHEHEHGSEASHDPRS